MRARGEEAKRGLLGVGAIQSLDRGFDALKRLAGLDQLLDLRLRVGELQMPFPSCPRRKVCRTDRADGTDRGRVDPANCGDFVPFSASQRRGLEARMRPNLVCNAR